MKDLGIQDSAVEAVEAAMARVLQAEQDARGAVERARAEAERIAEQARAAARVVAERSRERIAGGRERLERSMRAELAAIAQASRALPEHDAPDEAAIAHVQRAVRSLAAALTGGPEDSPR